MATYPPMSWNRSKKLNKNLYASASRVEDAIADGSYNLVPEPEWEDQDRAVNLIVATQDPPEPEANPEQEGKP